MKCKKRKKKKDKNRKNTEETLGEKMKRIDSIGYDGINIYYNRIKEICVPYHKNFLGIKDPELMNYVSSFARNIAGELKNDKDSYWDAVETKVLEFVIVYLLEETGWVSREDIAKTLFDVNSENFADFVLRCVNKRFDTLCFYLYEPLLLVPNKVYRTVLTNISVYCNS